MDRDKDEIFSILQSLKEMNLNNSMHKLEEESGLYFNLDHFQDLFIGGRWVELESYLSSFTTFHESSNVFGEIMSHKHRDAVNRLDEELYKELFTDQYPPAKAFILGNTPDRQEVLLMRYDDTDTVRARSLERLIKMIKVDPNLREKLDFPAVPVPPAPIVDAAADAGAL